jgi:hypothetical protein
MNYGNQLGSQQLAQMKAQEVQLRPVERNPDGLGNLLDQLSDRLQHLHATVERLDSKLAPVLVASPPAVQTKEVSQLDTLSISPSHRQLLTCIRQVEISVDYVSDIGARFVP